MDFGKKYRVGNFEVLKYTKSFGKNDVKSLRAEMDIPEDMAKHFRRHGMPYIKVSAVSGSWCVEYACTMSIFRLIDDFCGKGNDELYKLFIILFSCSTVVYDAEFYESLSTLIDGYIKRQQERPVEEEHGDELKNAEALHNAGETISDMAEELKKDL